MRKLLLIATMTLSLLVSIAHPQESAKLEPRYRMTMDTLKRKLGPNFAVKKVGMFVVASELDPTRSVQYEELITRIEQALYGTFVSRHADYVIRIVLFRDNASLQTNARKVLVKSPLPGIGGFFFEYEKAVLADGSMGAWLLRHELTHALLYVDFAGSRRASWLDEGLASLMESARLDDAKVVLRRDWRLDMARKLLVARKLPRLGDTLRLDFRAYYASPQERIINDAVGTSFLLFLDERESLVPFYKSYRIPTVRDSDPAGVKSVEKVLGKTIDEVEADWLAWLAQGAAQPDPGSATDANP